MEERLSAVLQELTAHRVRNLSRQGGVRMPSSEHRSDLARRLTRLFVVAVLVNYP